MKQYRLGVGFLLVLLALAARFAPGPRTIDDAYITFRYARNLLNGEGFVYNPGEKVMGTTTPFYTLLLAGTGALAGGANADFPSIALAVNALADAATCLLLWRVGRGLGSERAGIAAAAAWAIAPYSVTFAIGGLETSVYVLLLTAAFAFYLEQRYLGCGLAAALALLTRVDALILLGLIGLDWLVRAMRAKEPFPARAALAFLVPVIAWYGFAVVYFGSPFPHSVLAKLVAYRLEPNASLIRLIQHYATPFLEYNLIKTTAIAILIGILLYPFLFFLGARKALKSNPRSLPWLVYPWLYFAAFAIPNPLIFRWYLTPPLPAYFMLILLGLDQVVSGIFSRVGSKNRLNLQQWLPVFILLVYPLAFSLAEWRLHPDHGPDRPAPDMAYIQLELLYKNVAQDLAPQMTQETYLAAGDVGVMGYYTPAKILDTVGLNSEEALRYYPLDPRYYVINYAVAPDLIVDQKPDYVVILEVYGRNGLLKDPRFQKAYSLQQTVPTDMYGSDGMLVFKHIQ